jgi:hypothetical protein
MRGQGVWPHRVPLEPPFRPFLATQRTRADQIIDDGRKAGLWKRLRSSVAQAPLLPGSEPDAPEVRPPDARDIAELRLLAPEALIVKGELATRLIASLGTIRDRIGFEVIGTTEGVSVQLACAPPSKRAVANSLRAYCPEVKVREEVGSLVEAWITSGDYFASCCLVPEQRVFRSLRVERKLDTDPLIEIVGHLDDLAEGELGFVQILFERARAQWGEELLSFVNAIEDEDRVLPLIQEKFGEPLFAVVIRVVALAADADRSREITVGLAGAVQAVTRSEANELSPTASGADQIDAEALDILDRESRRSGALMSLSELATLVHIPSASVRSSRLLRQSGRTKPAPDIAIGHRLILGTNEHDGEIRIPSLSPDQRLRHVYAIGASGTGKSTLLLSMAAQDIAAGNGFAVLDPHGDLIEDILARIPSERADDVILFDPADEAFPIGFNILSAHSELERTLLASDLVSVFKRLSTTFGDVMVNILGNAVLAFLESSEGGTLIDLRDFLIDPAFRAKILRTVQDNEVISYWQREFPLLKGVPHAPVLTRLNTFLRPKLVRRMVAQKTDRLDFRRIMDSRTIFLAKLSQGAIGEENAHLLGSLLVSKLSQAAMSRQNVEQANREPYVLYIDEFHHFVTPSIASILSGARKYGLGLVLAHQETRQLRSRNEDVASAVLANAGTRVVFRVGETDAKSLADGFTFFEAKDLQSLAVGEAIARVERADFDFNLRTQRLEPVEQWVAAERRAAVAESSRRGYAIPREGIDARLAASREERPAPEAVDEARAATKRRKTTVRDEAADSGPMPGRGGSQHKFLQRLVTKVGEERGFDVSLEKTVLDGHGHIDALLERDGVRIGCEISVSTRPEHEVGNLTKCLAAGLDYAVLVSLEERTLVEARRLIEVSDQRLRFVAPDAFISFLDEVVSSRQGREPTPTERPASRRLKPITTEGLGDTDLLTTEQAAARLGLAVGTLAKMRVSGDGPLFHKVGRLVMYSEADLAEWIKARRRRSTSDPGPDR